MSKTLIERIIIWFEDEEIVWHKHILFIVSVIAFLILMWWFTTKMNQKRMLKKHLKSANDQLWLGIERIEQK